MAVDLNQAAQIVRKAHADLKAAQAELEAAQEALEPLRNAVAEASTKAQLRNQQFNDLIRRVRDNDPLA